MKLVDLDFDSSAFKHGVTEDEIEDCLFNEDIKPLILRSEQDPQVKVAYGKVSSGRFLEVAFRLEGEDLWVVFHAMPMRPRDRSRFKKTRGL